MAYATKIENGTVRIINIKTGQYGPLLIEPNVVSAVVQGDYVVVTTSTGMTGIYSVETGALLRYII